MSQWVDFDISVVASKGANRLDSVDKLHSQPFACVRIASPWYASATHMPCSHEKTTTIHNHPQTTKKTRKSAIGVEKRLKLQLLNPPQ
jgi:hypothetical protein